ncbi:tail fiber assembly protein [Xenorhabdus bovienii]
MAFLGLSGAELIEARVKLYQVDCTTAPDIPWPEQPKQ